jgi:hypothetical protein
MNVVDPLTRSGYRPKGVATMHIGDVYDSRASKREVRGHWRPGIGQLNSGPGRITIASTFHAAPGLCQSAASRAFAVATASKTRPRRTGSMRALPHPRAA